MVNNRLDIKPHVVYTLIMNPRLFTGYEISANPSDYWRPGDRVYCARLAGTVAAAIPGMVRVHWDAPGHIGRCSWHQPAELHWAK